ncbi:MAG: PAS domain-containing protein [Rhodospirillales bacterium]|nr:PAS domain-containing protein [Rhodospirillales bacterium]
MRLMSNKRFAALRERAELLDILDGNCGVGLWDVVLHNGDPMHPQSHWTWSSEFRRLCGYQSRDEFPDVVQSWSDRLHPDDLKQALEVLGKACIAGGHYEMKYRLRRKDGQYRWFHATGGIILDERRVARRACGSLVDVHDAQQAELNRRATSERLVAQLEGSVGKLVSALSGSAQTLHQSAQGMASGAASTGAQAEAVSAAAAQANGNVQAVAAAAEELSASVAEIGRQVSQSTQVASRAASDARRTDATVQTLAGGAQRIGEVVRLISDIAGQTNLLALNATIEAARAGEAGKGFAVVASEVKTLASQTGKATEDIASQIGQIQSATRDVVEAIRGITLTIDEVNQITAAIAAAVQQQGAATEEIARNVQQAAGGADLVTRNIAGVSAATTQTREAAAEVLGAADVVSSESERLGNELSTFVAAMKAA